MEWAGLCIAIGLYWGLSRIADAIETLTSRNEFYSRFEDIDETLNDLTNRIEELQPKRE